MVMFYPESAPVVSCTISMAATDYFPIELILCNFTRDIDFHIKGISLLNCGIKMRVKSDATLWGVSQRRTMG